MAAAGHGRKIATYREFWPHYLREHARPATRNLHVLGIALALASLAAAFAIDPLFGLLALVAGYGFAWIAHVFVERNRPATFTHPLWSLVSDFRMAWLWATGHLEDELYRAGIGR
jgi:hypothetical protein